MATAVAPNPVREFFAALRPRTVRSHHQFAEEEIVLAKGPRRGLHFQADFMPWTGLVLDEFTAGRYRRFFGTGPAQCSKTLLFFVIPALYHLFEIREDVIIGVPVIDLAQSIFEERLKPSIVASGYDELLPTRGSGSRGGRFLAVKFLNGATLRFMAAGGGDVQRASHTARVVILTELDKMDQPGAVSREADPVSQIEARTRAFGSRARIYGECTTSIETGRIHREVSEFGTDSRIFIPCPYCEQHVAPERASFTGWQGADDILSAREGATFGCPRCGAPWSEADRAQALTAPVLAARGQTVDRKGNVQGDAPRTNTFGVGWNSMHSALTTMGDIAEAEWRAERSDRPDDMKLVLQFIWATPWRDDLTDLSGISRDLVLQKITKSPRGVVPAGTRLVVFVDLGLYRCWWTAWAFWPDARGLCIDYGSLDVPQGRQAKPAAILTTLRAFRDEVLEQGWEGGEEPRRPDLVLVDAGWQARIAYAWVRESGQGRYFAAKGFGTGRDQQAWRPPKAEQKRGAEQRNWFFSPQPNGIRLVCQNADHWKEVVHEGFAAPLGAPGSLSLYKAASRDHLTFARQICAERQEEEFRPGTGRRIYWNRIHKDNHDLDCTAGCCVGRAMLGIRLLAASRQATDSEQADYTPAEDTPGWKIGR